MHITAHTQPSGDEPNEDWFAAADGLVVVLDGATIRTDTGCVHGLPWYVRTLGASLVANAADHARDLRGVLADSIRQVEDGDPLGARVPRNKARDDATAVLVETRDGRRRHK